MTVTSALDLYLYGEQIATIRRERGVLQLRYELDYVMSDGSVPVSIQFPVSPGRYSGDKVERFLENLLPDREDVRSEWARDAGLDTTAAFDLLSVYGADVAGALEFYPEGNAREAEVARRPLSDEEIAKKIRRIRRDDSKWTEPRAVNHPFSLGGAQGKFALAFEDGAWFEPEGSAPSTHIFKPGVKDLEGSDVTEHVTMEIARQLGLAVAGTQILEFDGEHVLAVERFDRRLYKGSYLRIHQEDLAQATGTSVLKKYEKDGGPSLQTIFEVLDMHLARVEALDAKRRFAESLIFAWIVGHNDGHTKNYSIQLFPGATVFSPLYDLNSSLVFEPESTCRACNYSAYDALELAFSVRQSYQVGDFSQASISELEQAAELREGYLAKFAGDIESRIADVLRDAIDDLPERLRELTAIKNYPFVIFAQRKRVRDVLDGA